MKGHRTEVEVCEVDTAPPQSEQQEGSNQATAEDLGLGSSGGSDTPDLGLVDLDRAAVADALYVEALPVLEDLAGSPQVEALGQQPAEQTDGLDEDVPCEDAGFEDLPAFLSLIDLWHRALSDLDDPVFPLLEESLYAAADAAGGSEGLAQALASAREEALRTAECDPLQQDVLGDVGRLPVDAAALADLPSLGPLPPETCPVPVPRTELPDLGTCDPVTVVGTVPEALPPMPGAEQILAMDPDGIAGLEASVAFCDELHAEVPPSGIGDRLLDVSGTVLGSAIGPFATSAAQNFGDALVLDTVGRLADDALAARLLASGRVGASKVPLIGPGITIFLAVLGFKDGPEAWWDDQIKDFVGGGTDLRDAFVELGAAWEALSEGEGWEALTHGLNTWAESSGGLGQLCSGLATVCGLLSAILYVATFALTATGVGVAAAPICLALAQSLASASTALGVAALAMYATSTMWRTLAATVAPVDMYHAQSELLEESSKTLGESGGGFVGDQLGGTLATHAHETYQARHDDPGRGAHEGPDGQPAGEQAGQREIESTQQQVDAHGESVETHAEKAGTAERAPADSKGFDVDAFLTGWGARFREGMGDALNLSKHTAETRAHAEQAYDLAGQARDRPDDRTLAQLTSAVRLVGDQQGHRRDDLEVANAAVKARRDELDAYLKRDARHDPPNHDHVQTLTELNVSLSEAKREVDRADADIAATKQLLVDTEQLLAGERERLKIDVTREEIGDSSGNATGGVGSAYAELFGVMYGGLLHALGLSEEAEEEGARLVRCVDQTTGSVVTALQLAQDSEAGNASLYVVEHADEIQADLDALEAAHDRLETLLAPPPIDSLQAPVDAAETMEVERDGYLQDQAAAYVLGVAEGAANAGESLLLPAEAVDALDTRAEGLVSEVDEALDGTERSEQELSEAQGEAVELPGGLMGELGEAERLAGEHGDMVAGGGEVAVPQTDPAEGLQEMDAAMAEQRDRLAADRASLQSTRRDAQATRAALAEPLAAVREDHSRLVEGRDEVAAERTSAEADALAHRGSSEAAADEVATDVGTLQAWADARAGESR